MLYDLILKITYEYENAATAGRQLLRLEPRHIEGRQHVHLSNLTIAPAPTERRDRFDFYRNKVTEVAFHNNHPQLEFKVKARLECLPQNYTLNISPDLSGLRDEILELKSLDPFAPHHSLSTSLRIPRNKGISQFAQETIRKDLSVLEIVETIGLTLHKEMTFDAEATKVDTPTVEAFEQKRGVCQDFSHIMIACLRSLGIPAGYVSGFIRTIPPEGSKERLDGADAMHAWVRAWVGKETGWVEYDPTNAMFVSTDHIVVAFGQDYDDVAPIKGILKTYGQQSSRQAVDVIPLTEPPRSSTAV